MQTKFAQLVLQKFLANLADCPVTIWTACGLVLQLTSKLQAKEEQMQQLQTQLEKLQTEVR